MKRCPTYEPGLRGCAGRGAATAADAVPKRIAMLGTGAISHWPATLDPARPTKHWDREFLRHWEANDKEVLLANCDEATNRAGQGGFECGGLDDVAYDLGIQ